MNGFAGHREMLRKKCQIQMFIFFPVTILCICFYIHFFALSCFSISWFVSHHGNNFSLVSSKSFFVSSCWFFGAKSNHISWAWLNCNVHFHQQMTQTTFFLVSVCSHLMPKKLGNTKHHDMQNSRGNAFQLFDVYYTHLNSAIFPLA